MRLRDLSYRLKPACPTRIQYSLRSLLIVTLVACLALGWWANSSQRQRAAVAAIKEAGGHVTYRASAPAYPSAPDDDPFGDSTPPTAAGHLQQQLIGRAYDLLGIDYFQRVEAVQFGSGDDFGPVLDRLTDLHGLAHLELPFALDEDLPAIGNLSALRSLDLAGGAITDLGLRHLDSLRSLRRLNLARQNVSDAALSILESMSEIEELDLSWTKMTDDGLPHLRTSRQLRELDLSGTLVSDRAVADLSALPALKRVGLSNTAVTEKGIATLRSLRPELKVDCTRPTDFADVSDLMRLGEWRRALETLRKQSGGYDQFWIAWMRGRCHAALGMLSMAERAYAEALASVPMAEGAVMHLTENTTCRVYYRAEIWAELCERTELFDRVTRHRSADPLRWEAEAWRFILHSRWREAADCYARAMRCPHDDETVCECVIARLASGDVPEALACTNERFSMHDGADEPTIEPQNDDQWNLAAKLWLYAPTGAIRLPGLTEWLSDEVTREWRRSGLGPLAGYRLESYASVARCAPPDAWHIGGQFWLVRAMALQRLGHIQQARDAYARAVRWIDRCTNLVRIRQNYTEAWVLLRTQALRREAEQLIFK